VNASCPALPVPPALRPRASRSVARPQPSLGFALQSFPLPRSRAASRRPSASLRVRLRPCLRREDSLAVRPVSTPRPAVASFAAPRERDTRSRHRAGERGFPAIVKTACPPRELPRTTTSTTDTGDLRARRHAAVSPASKPCSPRESVHAIDRASPPSLRPKELTADRAGALLGFLAPPELALPRPRVRSTARSPGGEAWRSRKSRAPIRTSEPRASILRPRPSGTSGGFGWPPYYLHRRTLRASAPPLGRRPCLSCP
jgi:hypothetical protein